MFVHRILLSNKSTVVSKNSINILKKWRAQSSNNLSTTSSDFDSFKDELPNEQPSTSLLHIKRSLKLNNTEFQDGITNLKTSCPICDHSEKSVKNEDIFINKTTGNEIGFSFTL